MMRSMHGTRSRILVVILVAFSTWVATPTSGHAADSQLFPETGHTVSGPFLDFWRANGGLAIFGLPITDATNEASPSDGQTYLIQWFERARMELHGDQVQLGNLGRELRAEALAVDPDFQRADVLFNTAQPQESQHYFPETGHNLRFTFLDYWNANGGLALFGLPISEEHPEADAETGNTYIVQWFERARFAFHPENPSGAQVVLGALGRQAKTPKPGALDSLWKIGKDYNSLTKPRGIAIDATGNIYVADTGGNRVQKYGPDRRLLTRWGSKGTGDGQFDNPIGIAVDGAGNVYVADYLRVQKFNGDGAFLTKWQSVDTGTGSFSFIQGMAVDRQGAIYVTDQAHLYRFDGDGHLLGSWDTTAKSPGGRFARPSHTEEVDSDAGTVAVDAAGNVYLTDVTAGQVVKFDASGQLLAVWGGEGDGDGKFFVVQNVAVDAQGNVYVSDLGGHRVQKFDPNGQFLLRWGSGGFDDGQFNRPAGVAIDSQGRIYVVDSFDNRVQMFDGNGTYLAKWGVAASFDSQFFDPAGIAADGQGDFFVVDAGYNRVTKFDSSGRFLTKWGSLGRGDGEFDTPVAIAVDAQGSVYVSDRDNHRIEKFDNAGRFLTQWGSAGGDGQASDIEGIAVDSHGNVFTSDPQANVVQKFDGSGQFLMKWGSHGSGDGQFDDPDALAIDATGIIYVVDRQNHRVQKFDGNGQFLGKWGSEGGDAGQFSYPHAIALDGNGNVYVADGISNGETIRGRIQRFDQSGRFLSQGTVRDIGRIAVGTSGDLFATDASTNRVLKIRQR
ncbi:MAG: hypothetical protein LC793_13615 [Thermomicrobia bacterium]|nr:hypothetical protein [Thermomicrobia bacterium]MCA1724676.1 hypothetical protein [Thermomicrobia bacterium]